ncbi:hypothetical protein RUND412_009203 [Rhizina undulata]
MSANVNKRQKLSPKPKLLLRDKASWPGWCTLESEPAVFNDILRQIGVKGTQVEEVYSLDADSLKYLTPAHGLVFLFRWKQESGVKEPETTCPESIWFANQVTDNACASLAMLNIIYNCPDVEFGEEMHAFKDFTMGLTPPLRGLAFANFEYMRKIHNAFARNADMMDADINLVDNMKRKTAGASGGGEDDDEEVFHFIAYIHHEDAVWELDGLKKQPVMLETCGADQWLSIASAKVQERISRYPEGELRFTLLAFVPEAVPILKKRLASNARLLGQVQKRLDEVNPDWKSFMMDELENSSEILADVDAQNGEIDPEEMEKLKTEDEVEVLMGRRSQLISCQKSLGMNLKEEEDKVANHIEIARGRKSDYEIFAHKVCQLMAKRGLVKEHLR